MVVPNFINGVHALRAPKVGHASRSLLKRRLKISELVRLVRIGHDPSGCEPLVRRANAPLEHEFPEIVQDDGVFARETLLGEVAFGA